MPPPKRGAFLQGFTLMEVMVTLLIIGIMASVAGPVYLRTVERSYWKATRDILQTIYSGEWVYESINDQFVDPADIVAAPAGWRTIHMDSPNGSVLPVTFTVSNVAPTTFTVTATRNGGGTCNTLTQTINQDRVIGGTWPASGNCP